jgi:ribosomal protein L40E
MQKISLMQKNAENSIDAGKCRKIPSMQKMPKNSEMQKNSINAEKFH